MRGDEVTGEVILLIDRLELHVDTPMMVAILTIFEGVWQSLLEHLKTVLLRILFIERCAHLGR